MSHSKLILKSLLNALGVVVYVLLVALVILNANQLFGQVPNVWGPFAFLLLFVFSAAVVGILIFGQPVMLFLSDAKKEAVKMLGYTIGWLFLAILITLLIFVVF